MARVNVNARMQTILQPQAAAPHAVPARPEWAMFRQMLSGEIDLAARWTADLGLAVRWTADLERRDCHPDAGPARLACIACAKDRLAVSPSTD
jgi:hypothetical protein